ncbi:MAG: diguanylate cyclase (GGDEF)-like protein [Candidatus Paceibacteria bacterium]|jgi:diguanylate cyclase (GGDEF)-like protein
MTRVERSKNSQPEVLSLAQIQHLMRVEFSRAQRYSYPIVCLVLALDQLGDVRDRRGYEAKEEVLEEFILLLHEQTRGSDFLGRLPDDRFMIVVPHTIPDQVRILADRLVAGTREMRLPQLGEESMTLSIGASFMLNGEILFFDDLLNTARSCLAEASSAGGDQVQFRAPEGLL